MNCQTSVAISDNACPNNVLSATVLDCSLLTSIGVNTSLIGTPYVITFEDGSLGVSSSSNNVNHTFGSPGNYEVCLTYTVPDPEPKYITCCYMIEVALPPGCVCPTADIITVEAIEPCTWNATLCFNLANFPFFVDFGDGTSGTFTDPCIDHQFPGPGTYHVCFSYTPPLGGSIICCEEVVIPGCCLNPNFEMEPITGPSCINPLYRIDHIGCQGGIVAATHLWEFSDGTVFTGPNPPDHLFTNFLDFGGLVCVTHTITCCNETASATVCLPHTPGAYLGTPNQTLLMSQTLPFTNNTVLHFIQQNQNITLPLTIDGTLIVDVPNATFGVGTWNMGGNADILVQGIAAPSFRSFTLDGTIIHSAFRLYGSTACCRWQGIHSEGRTRITLTGASVKDADYAIRYPATQGVVGGSAFPQISSTGSFFINNFYGIKSEGQFVNFTSFSDNTMNGAQENPHVCGCQSVNAFDFSNINPLMTVNINGTIENEVFNYEKAFNFNNSRLRARGFEIHNLKDYDPVPLPFNNNPGDAAIGIDYRWSTSNNSSLNIDRIGFTNFQTDQGTSRSVAVRENITRGLHTLTATAGQQSIFIGNVAAGYELIVGSSAKINGTIQGNTINTNGGTQFGFGINGSINSGNNILNVRNNTMSISTNSSSTLNGGVVLASSAETTQDYNILDNTIDVVLNNNGVGIGITNARGFSIRRNKLLNPAGVTGIQLKEGGSGQVDCNDVRDKTKGIDVSNCDGVRYADNNLRSNKRDLLFTGDAMSVNGSLIEWNTFRNSDFESIKYSTSAVTGLQTHNQYNQWEVRSGIEVVHGTGGSTQAAFNSRFFHPFGAPSNSVMRPLSSPIFMFTQNAQGVSIDSVPGAAFCTAVNDAVVTSSSLLDPAGTWASIVQDANYWNGLTTAEQTMMRQEVYGLLLAHPSWTSGNTTLSGFKAAQDAGFVGQSESLHLTWKQLLNSISTHQAAQASNRTALASLSDQVEGWLAAIAADPNQEASLQPLIDAALQQGDMLIDQLQQADDLFFPTVQTTVGQLLSQNAALDESTLHTWCEKRYNQIALNSLAGILPDATATTDLRSIAQTCVKTGGRAVLGARGLCETWLKEYYDEDNCKDNPQGRSNDDAANLQAEISQMLRIVPNPADDMVRISLAEPIVKGETIKVQFLTLSGQVVHTADMTPESGELAISVLGWHDGIYVARTTRGTETFSQTFVVQHR